MGERQLCHTQAVSSAGGAGDDCCRNDGPLALSINNVRDSFRGCQPLTGVRLVAVDAVAAREEQKIVAAKCAEWKDELRGGPMRSDKEVVPGKELEPDSEAYVPLSVREARRARKLRDDLWPYVWMNFVSMVLLFAAAVIMAYRTGAHSCH